MPSDYVFSMIHYLKEKLRIWLYKRHVKSFITCIANPDLRLGAQALIQTCELGKLRPNIVIMGFKHNWSKEIISIATELCDKNFFTEKQNSIIYEKLYLNERFHILLSELNQYFAIIQLVLKT